jgi:hypothetical protein
VAVSFNAFGGTGTLGTPANPLTWSHTTASGATLLVACIAFNDAGRTVTAATHGGVALTRLGGWTSGTAATDRHVELWYRTSPPAGTATISFTVSAPDASRLPAGNSITFFGSDLATPFGTVQSGSATAAESVQPDTLTVSSAVGEMIIHAIAGRGNTAPTAPTGSSGSRTEQSGSATPYVYAGMSYRPGAPSVASAWTMPADNSFAVVAVPIRQSTGSTLNRLKTGDSTINAIRVGDVAASRVYSGDTQVWP